LKIIHRVSAGRKNLKNEWTGCFRNAIGAYRWVEIFERL
jgi:hypothetical protein